MELKARVDIQQVILPLLEQYVKSHRLYFVSTALCSGGNQSHASKKEKEMIAWYVLNFSLALAHFISMRISQTHVSHNN